VAEALIRQRVEDWAKALCAKDIDSVMSLYHPTLCHSISFRPAIHRGRR
jgi:ketosteroid isomerase-like protein